MNMVAVDLVWESVKLLAEKKSKVGEIIVYGILTFLIVEAFFTLPHK